MFNIGDVAHQNSGSEVPVSNPASTNPDVLQGYCEILSNLMVCDKKENKIKV